MVTTTLDTLAPGARGAIVAVRGEGMIAQRLAEMGMVPGAEVTVVRFAPLGDPMEILLDGYHLSLRKSEAAKVEIQP